MSAETVVKAALEVAGVTALCGTRIYPDARPQENVLPAIVYVRSSTNFVMTIHGTVALTRSQIGIGCYAVTRAAAEALADAAHTALLVANLIPLNRSGDFEDETNNYLVALLYEHLAP